jgi:hypothetical protein
VFKHPDIADQFIEAARDAALRPDSKGPFIAASFDFRG